VNVRQLEVFHAVMRAESVSDAARLLGVSQPAVTKSLRLLEQDLGFALFRRVGGRIFPGAAAEALLPEVARIERDVEAVAELARRLRDGQAGRLQVVSASSLAERVLPQALGLLRRERPGVHVELLALPSRAVVDRVAERRADLGFVYDPTDNPQVESRDILEAEVVCAVPRRHALARRPVLGPADLSGVPLVTYGGDTRIGGALRRVMREAGILQEPEVTTNSTRLALQLVAEGGGVAVVDPFLFGRAGVPGLVAVRFQPAISLRVRVIRSYERPRSLAGDALLRLVARVGAELGMRPATRSRRAR
jgi:DNA-binding transcriptional LysR family regulator